MPVSNMIAFCGAALAAAAVVMLVLVVFFGDLFLGSDRALQKWMDAIMWCMAGGLFAVSVTAAWAVVRLHH